MGDGPQKAWGQTCGGTSTGRSAPAAPAAEKKDDFDPADFLMEGSQEGRRPACCASLQEPAPAAKKSDPAMAVAADAAVAGARGGS